MATTPQKKKEERPPRSHNLSEPLIVLLRPEDKKDLVSQARQQGMSRGALVRSILGEVLGWDSFFGPDGEVPKMQRWRDTPQSA